MPSSRAQSHFHAFLRIFPTNLDHTFRYGCTFPFLWMIYFLLCAPMLPLVRVLVLILPELQVTPTRNSDSIAGSCLSFLICYPIFPPDSLSLQGSVLIFPCSVLELILKTSPSSSSSANSSCSISIPVQSTIQVLAWIPICSASSSKLGRELSYHAKTSTIFSDLAASSMTHAEFVISDPTWMWQYITVFLLPVQALHYLVDAGSMVMALTRKFLCFLFYELHASWVEKGNPPSPRRYSPFFIFALPQLDSLLSSIDLALLDDLSQACSNLSL